MLTTIKVKMVSDQGSLVLKRLCASFSQKSMCIHSISIQRVQIEAGCVLEMGFDDDSTV